MALGSVDDKRKRAGQAVGKSFEIDDRRHIRDSEGIISLDEDAIRIGYMSQPGWGRHAITYGPFRNVPGLFFSAFVLNGHNGSQTCIFWTSRKRRIFWGILRQLFMWLPSGWLPKSFRINIHPEKPHDYNWPYIRDNLAVGFFDESITSKPGEQGTAFLMRADNINNAKLLISSRYGKLPVMESVQNVPLYFIIGLRTDGAIFYTSSVPGVKGAAGYPLMRPVGLVTEKRHEKIHAGIHQSILGEIGFRVDTRIYGVRVRQLPEWNAQFGGAQFADSLTGERFLEDQLYGMTDTWTVLTGSFKRTVNGLCSSRAKSLVAVYPTEPSGLIHVAVRPESLRAPFGVCWRMQDDENFWCILFEKTSATLSMVSKGDYQSKAVAEARIKRKKENFIQILDEGLRFSVFLNGRQIFSKQFEAKDLQNAVGIGLYAEEAERICFRDFESHPRTLPIPKSLDLGAPWNPKGRVESIIDDFKGTEEDFNGRITSFGDKVWRKELGQGTFLLTGSGGVKVKADPENPNPGRTAYTVKWDDKHFTELETEILPPGTEKGQGHKGRGGFILWQDLDNYIIVNTYLDDWKVGKSISSFFVLNGEEDIYRAVWTNVGHRIHWGVPYTLRTVFDGLRYMVHLNGEPVLYRSLTDVYPGASPLSINRVGLTANWEFGDDTGSEFRYFVARGR
jgi:hypothetical protein